MLPPIATPGQADALGFTLGPPALMRASTRMRTYTRQEITRGASTAHLMGRGPWLMPQRPVVSVVGARDDAGNRVGVRLRGQTLLARGGFDVTVDYTHGHDPVPDGLVELCCVIAQRLGSVSEELVAGVQQQATGAESMSFGAWATDAVAELMPAERNVLDKFYPRRRPRLTMMTPAPLMLPRIESWD